MKLLCLDSSTKTFSLALTQETKVLRFRNAKLDKILSSSIIPAIEKILKESKIKLKDLDGMAVGLGPGSFTSLRVGLSTVKALAMATNKPVVGVSSLSVLALNAPQDVDNLCTLVDAKRNLVYACLYQKKAGKLKQKSEFLLTNIEGLGAHIKKDTTFIGDGLSILRPFLETQAKTLKLKYDFVPEKMWYPKAKNIPVLVLDKFHQNKYDDVDMMVPLYLYPEDCQVVPKK